MIEKTLAEPRIDRDLSPDNPHNREMARKLGWKFDPRTEYYLGSDGSIIADRYGQPL